MFHVREALFTRVTCGPALALAVRHRETGSASHEYAASRRSTQNEIVRNARRRRTRAPLGAIPASERTKAAAKGFGSSRLSEVTLIRFVTDRPVPCRRYCCTGASGESRVACAGVQAPMILTP